MWGLGSADIRNKGILNRRSILDTTIFTRFAPRLAFRATTQWAAGVFRSFQKSEPSGNANAYPSIIASPTLLRLLRFLRRFKYLALEQIPCLRGPCSVFYFLKQLSFTDLTTTSGIQNSTNIYSSADWIGDFRQSPSIMGMFQNL